MKITATKLILEKLQEIGEATLETFLPPNYSHTRLSRRLLGLDSSPKISPRTLSSLLSRLRKQGLVDRSRPHKKSSWSLTKKGEHFLIKKFYSKILERPSKDGVTRLVIFDIPERERKKRDTIRAELVDLDFKQLQKSVWIGYNPLTKDFVNLIDELNLAKMVHIFSIKEKGTIV